MAKVRGHLRKTKRGLVRVKPHYRTTAPKQWRMDWEREIDKIGVRYNLREVYEDVKGANEQIGHEIDMISSKIPPLERTIENMQRTGTGLGGKEYNKFVKELKGRRWSVKRLESQRGFLTIKERELGRELKRIEKKGIRTFR